MVFLISAYLLIYFYLCLKRLDWAVLFLIAALPSYLIRFKIFGLPFTLLEEMILIVFAVWLLRNYKQIIENLKAKFPISNFKFLISKRYPFDIEIVLLLIISFVAAGVSGFSNEAMGIWKAYFFEPILLFLVIINVFRIKDFGKIILAFAVSAFFVSIAAIYQKITGQFIFNEFWAIKETRRTTSFFGYPNAVGLYLGPIVLISVGWLISSIKNFKFTPPVGGFNFKLFLLNFFISSAIILSLLSVYFAKSVGAMLGIGAGLILFSLLAGKKSRRIAIAAIIIFSIFTVAYQSTRNEAKKLITFNTFSGNVRKLQWLETWKMLSDGRLIFGAGLANYQKSIAPYHQEGFFYNKYNDPNFHRKTVFNEGYREQAWQPLEIYLYPHNIFLNFWSELGLAGMLLFIWIFIKFYYLSIKILFKNLKLKIKNSELKNSQYTVIGFVGAITVIFIHGLVDVPYFKNDLATMFWVLLAILGIIDLELKREKH